VKPVTTRTVGLTGDGGVANSLQESAVPPGNHRAAQPQLDTGMPSARANGNSPDVTVEVL
jgi:hypothetical protein